MQAINVEREIEIIVPVLNEELAIPVFISKLSEIMNFQKCSFSVTFVDDGSSDKTPEVIASIQNLKVKLVKLSRNFGKEIAVQAALNLSEADAVIIIDVDLQDPIEKIPAMIEKWGLGYEIVYGVRVDRSSDSFFKRKASSLFYRTFSLLADISIPPHASDFRLMSRKAVLALKGMNEIQRWNKGLFHWIGFQSIGVEYERSKRVTGKSKWRAAQLFRLAQNAFLGFSVKPLRWITSLGIAIGFFSILLAFFYSYQKLFLGITPPGYASVITAICVLGGVQLTAIGIIGQYLSIVLENTKGRPLYIIDTVLKNNKY